MEQEARLLADEELCCSSCSLRQCRICHEEEEDDKSCAAMESPCACSGSLKYAHRGCVQRWCDEKGSTLCEICLQNFEPGYMIPPKKAQLVEVAVTIRGSLEVPRLNHEPRSTPPDGLHAAISDRDYAECSRAAGRSASWCRMVVAMLTIILLLRHLIAVATVGADQYAFSLHTVYLLRASGILLPFYAVMRLISAIQQGQRQYRLQQLEEQRRNASSRHSLHDRQLQLHIIPVL